MINISNKQWDETLSSGDCISDYSEWNDMITYIKYHGTCSYTIHRDSDVSDSQLMKFTTFGSGCSDGTPSIVGTPDTGDDFVWKANETDAYPYVKLEGDSDISLYSSQDIYFYEDATELFKFYDNSIDFMNDRAIYIDDDETYIGHGAGDNISSGVGNTLVGHDAGNDLTTGDYNTVIGYEAMDADANNCVCIGAYAGENNTQSNIVAIGFEALEENTGVQNTAVGYRALANNITGTRNTAVGMEALKSNTSGERNTTIGRSAGRTLNSSENVIIGQAAGFAITSGEQNTIIGRLAGGTLLTSGSRNVLIGYNAGANSNASDRLYINNSTSAYPLIYGEFDNDVVKFGDNSDEFFFKFSFDASDAIVETESTNNNIYLKPDGTGVVKFGTHSALSGETVSGYITIKDAGGTTRKLAVVS